MPLIIIEMCKLFTVRTEQIRSLNNKDTTDRQRDKNVLFTALYLHDIRAKQKTKKKKKKKKNNIDTDYGAWRL